MNITGTQVKVNVRGITGWALMVLGVVLGLTGPLLSGATIAAVLLIASGAVLVVDVMQDRRS